MNISLRRIANNNMNKPTLRRCSPCISINIGAYSRALDPLSVLFTINDFPKLIYDNGYIKCLNFVEPSLHNLSVFDNRHL